MKNILAAGIAVVALACGAAFAGAEALKPVQLPPPRTDGGKPLMQALKLRATSRAFAPDPLPLQTLSDLLWAAWGINRPAEGKRTAPSARNWQEIDVLLVDAKGAWRYDAAATRSSRWSRATCARSPGRRTSSRMLPSPWCSWPTRPG